MRRLRALVVDDVIDLARTIASDLELAGFEAEVGEGGAATGSWTTPSFHLYSRESP